MAITESPPRQRVRRNRITTLDAALVAAVAAVAAVAGALAGAHPTAWAPADVVLAGALAALVAWAGASAPWWILAGGAGIAALAVPSAGWTTAAAVGFLLAAVIGAQRLSWPPGRAASAGLTIVTLLHWGSTGFHGATALVTGVIAATIVVGGLQRRRSAVRRTALRVLALVAIVGGLAIAGGAIATAIAYGDLRDGEQALRAAANALADGDVDAAVEQLEVSQQRLAGASSTLDSAWALPVRAVPVVGQHVEVTSSVAGNLEDLSATLVETSAQINVDALRVEGGVIDINAIEVLERPLSETEAVLAQTAEALVTDDSSWLVAPVDDLITTIRDEIDDLHGWTRDAITGVRLAPSMLGRDEPRTYFVAFTTPAESRGLSGFMGTWAELRVDGGRLDVTRTGQTTELTSAMDGALRLEGPQDYLERYGKFGAGGDGRPVVRDFWSNVTMSPDFPSVTEVIAQLYPAAGGRQIDGALTMDVDTVARFLELTGPIEVAGPDGVIRLDSGNAEEYLLRDQYADIVDDEVRDAVLEQITSRLIAEVFAGSLPGPRVLAGTLGPAVSEGRLAVWSLREEDQASLQELGLSGALPVPSPDGLAVVSNNAAANKLDAYLNRSISYEAVIDEETGTLTALVTVRLTNSAPGDLPDDVGGNPFGLPAGTNRTYLSVYSPWTLTAAALDGRAAGMEPSTELGWNVYSRYVEIPAGGEVVVQLQLEGDVPLASDYELSLWSQPLAFPDVVRVDVRTTDGEVLHSSHRVRAGVERLGDDTVRSGAAGDR